MQIKNTVQTDVVIVGGGIAGLMAAIRAADQGAQCLVVEKAHVNRSGSGATGNDHFLCYIPELHGSIDTVLAEVAHSQTALCQENNMVRYHMEHSFDMIRLWHEWGINMQPTGQWHCSGHAFPERPRIWLKYEGANQKAVLVAQAKKRGVRFLNHHPVVELLHTDGAVAGVLALDTRSPEASLVPIAAKAVVMATGCTTRLYNNAATPGWMFNQAYCPSCAGALAQGWRIGARMVNMELPNRHAGTKYFARCGKATWVGVYRYPDGKPLGPFVTKPDIHYGDMVSDIWSTAFTDVMRSGKGPAYLDCSQLNDEEYAYMHKGMISEGLTSQLAHMADKGIDPRRHAIEFMQYEPHIFARGFDITPEGATSVLGLYAAGDTIGNFRGGIAGAVVFGWSCGTSAASYARGHSQPEIDQLAAIQTCADTCTRMLTADDGPSWKESNLALQQIMSDYAAAGPNLVRSENLLRAGRLYLEQLRTAAQSMRATCSHTLMRCFEVLDLMDCGEIILHAASQRKESRALHQRADYTFTNPLLANKFLQIWKEGKHIHSAWRIRQSA